MPLTSPQAIFFEYSSIINFKAYCWNWICFGLLGASSAAGKRFSEMPVLKIVPTRKQWGF